MVMNFTRFPQSFLVQDFPPSVQHEVGEYVVSDSDMVFE